MKTNFVSFEEDLKQRLLNPEFAQEWGASEASYQIARQTIKARLEKKMSQRDLARKAKTSQARISKLESMRDNPSLAFLQKISSALGMQYQLSV